MVDREWTIELSKSAEDNMDQILLYISQNISQQQVQAFLRGFHDTLEDIKHFPRMYAKLPDLDDPNIRHFIYNKYKIVYELIETERVIRILTIFHSHEGSYCLE
ncbi:MAG: type II toxin-antitoxin system RelE/ParE family toxin [Candidatus Lokiarchaeia archaeon]